ncbi:MAG: electron transport complex subunit E [Spirochaetaceae bacterium]|nr:MAG: electron transport complex subunit E [Spirochaetaceae bacterium]
MAARSISYEFTKGLLRNNPVFVQVLGMCPVLAVSTSVVNGLGMGLATSFVLVSAALIASVIKPIVPSEVRIPVYAVVIATFVTIADLVLRAFFPPLSASLGPYVPLIVVNCVIMGRIEAFATRNRPIAAVSDALGMGAGFTAALMVLGAVREVLGSGAFFGIELFGEGFTPLLVMILPAGAFLTLGVLMAVFNAAKEGSHMVLIKAESKAEA